MQVKADKQNHSLAAIAARVFVIALLVLISLAVLSYFLLAGVIDNAAKHQGEIEHKRLVHAMQAQLEHYVGLVELLASDPVQIELLKNRRELNQRQQELIAVVGAARLIIIPAGQEKRYIGEFPRLTYTELDLIYEAQRTDKAVSEFMAANQGQGYVDIVRSIVLDKQVLGYLVVSFDGAKFLQAIGMEANPLAHVEMSQVLNNGSSQVFMSWGDMGKKTANIAHVGDVPGTRWQLSYWPAGDGWRLWGVRWQLVYWLGLLLVLMVLAGAVMLFQRLAGETLRASVNVYYEFVRDRLAGRWLAKRYSPALKELQPTLTQLQNLNWATATATERKSPLQVGDEKNNAQKKRKNLNQQVVAENSYIDLLYQNQNAVSVEESEGDAVLIERNHEISSAIFRAYDIRGIVDDTLTPDIVYDIGRAFGSEAWVQGEQTVIVGRDGRLSSKQLSEALIKGLLDSGRDVVDVGQVPTPLVYFATHYLSARSGVMVTGSHNPVNYNGLKMVLQGASLSAAAIQGLYQRVVSSEFMQGAGTLSQQDLVADYAARISSDVDVSRGLKVVVDCGNGVASEIAPQLLRSLGCEVIELFCSVDGRFPNHHPDPSQPENLQSLIESVKQHQADVGLAFDGDADRLGVVDSSGQIIWPDKQIMLFAADMLKAHPSGKIIYDVKCSRHLHQFIDDHGGQPLMWKSGHSLLKTKLYEEGALLAGEFSGHIFFNDRWYGFDDGLYAAARLLEILAKSNRSSHEIFDQLPKALNTPELCLCLNEGEHFTLIDAIKQRAEFPGADLNTIDGVRAEFADGWGLVRASNTTPCLTFRFEANDEAAMERIKEVFRKVVQNLDSGLKLPF